VDVIARLATLAQVEGLSEFQRLFIVTVNNEISTDETKDAIVEGGLRIERDNLMRNRWQGSQLFHNCCSAKELLTLVR